MESSPAAAAAAAPEISIIIPARNEEATLPLVLADLHRAIAALSPPRTCEIIVVEDHCADATAAQARAAGATVVSNPKAPGKGHALLAGFAAARGRIFVMLDADYSHRPEDLPLFLQHLAPGVGLVVGSRATGGSEEYTRVRTFGNVFLTAFFQLMLGIEVSDALNGFKAFRREIYTGYRDDYTARHFEIEIELLVNTLRSGQRIAEFPCHERARAGGVMKSHAIRHGIPFFLTILTEGLRYRLSRR